MKQFLPRLSPSLLLILYPFDISWGVFYHRLAKYGSINPYLLIFVLASCAFLSFDFYIQNRSKFSKELQNKIENYLFLAGAIFLSLLIKYLFLDYESPDYIEALSIWYDTIKENGGFAALKNGKFSDYNASYLYIMAFLTYLPIHKLYAIKLVSILFDYAAAFWIYKIVKLKYSNSSYAISAFALVIFAPSLILNGSLWAQCDVIYTSFLLMSAYYFIKYSQNKSDFNSKLLALFAFALALAFKLQAVFFVLPLLFLYLNKKIVWYQFLIIPLVLFLFILPNYFLGRAFMDLVLIYGHQVLNYPRLSLNCPNIYQLLPTAPYEFFMPAGIVLTFATVLLFAFLFLRKKIAFNADNFLRIAMISLLVIPFLLPKMHERYFFAADIFAILYAFYFPKRWFLPILIGGISIFSYAGFLFEPPFEFSTLALVLAGIIALLIVDFLKSINSKIVL